MLMVSGSLLWVAFCVTCVDAGTINVLMTLASSSRGSSGSQGVQRMSVVRAELVQAVVVRRISERWDTCTSRGLDWDGKFRRKAGLNGLRLGRWCARNGRASETSHFERPNARK